MRGSFEKKVQEKLDELKMTPSAPVWEKVEMQIQPDKRRRRAFFWIPFLVVLLAGGAFYFTSRQGGMPVSKESTTTNSVTADNKTLVKQEPSSTLNIPGKTKIETVTTGTLPKTPVSASVVTREMEKPSLHVSRMLSTENSKRLTIHENGTGLYKEKKAIIPAQPEPPAVSVINGHQSIPEKNGLAVAEIKEPVSETSITKSILAPVDSATKEEKKELNELPFKADTASVKRKIARSEPKWRKTVVLQGGRNRPASAIFSSAAADYYGSPTTGSSNSPQTGYNTGGTGQVKGGHSLAIGASLTRSISPHVAVSFGLQYTFHRLHSQVGTFRRSDTAFALGTRNTAVQGYYRNGSSTNYNINQHLLEVPVSISYKPVVTLPVLINVGASYGRLMQSNLLTYNSISNSYYYTADNNTKNFFSLFSSLQVSLLSRSAFQLSAGPVVQYQLTPMQEQKTATPMRLSFAGVRTNITF